MTVHIFPIVAKGKSKRFWLVSKSAGKQLRGDSDETLTDIQEQWETTWGQVDKWVRERDSEPSAAEAIISGMRQRFHERKAQA